MLEIRSAGKFGMCGGGKRKLNSYIGADKDRRVPRKLWLRALFFSYTTHFLLLSKTLFVSVL